MLELQLIWFSKRGRCERRKFIQIHNLLLFPMLVDDVWKYVHKVYRYERHGKNKFLGVA